MQFRLRVVDAENQLNEMSVNADSSALAVREANVRGLRVVAIASEVPRPSRPIGRFDTLLFSQELVALLDAGLTLAPALETLCAKAKSAFVGNVLQSILGSIKEGKTFSEGLAAYPQLFSDVYVATVRANERSGGLAAALSRHVAYQLQMDALKRKATAAAIYPALLLTVGTLVCFFLIAYVVPKFSAVYDASGRELPQMSALLIRLGGWIGEHRWSFLTLAAGAIASAVYALAQPAVRARLLDSLASLPVVRPQAREYRLGRLYRTLALLMAAGISLPRAVDISAGVLAAREQEALRRVRRALDEGRALSAALHEHGLSTTIADSLLRVGEGAGRLGEMLDRAAKFHDDEFARWLDTASRLLEPLLMAAIGLIIGAVVVLMYMPIFELAGSLG
jgi:general secretion pathway protein F